MNNLAEKKEAPTVPSVWIGCLAAYNSGRLHGEWVEIPTNIEALRDQIKKVIDTSPAEYAEEYFFADYENCPESFGEYEDLESLVNFANAVEEHGIDKVNAYLQFADIENLENIDDCYHGCWDSWDDFANEMADEQIACHTSQNKNEFLERYFDYEMYARDLSYDFNECWEGGSCYVFSNY